jgi:hypothetical protein
MFRPSTEFIHNGEAKVPSADWEQKLRTVVGLDSLLRNPVDALHRSLGLQI